jgi:hypothetical protein
LSETIHQALFGPEEYRNAIDAVLERARRKVRIFDFNLEGGGYNSPRRHELLQAFLLANPSNRLEIALHDTDYLVRSCPRLMSILRQFSHAVDFRQTTASVQHICDPFVLVDHAHYVHRFHYQRPRATMGLDDVPGAHILERRFEGIWEASATAVSATVLGL